MSYVGEPFEYDVFVSYAHAKDRDRRGADLRLEHPGRRPLRDLLATRPQPDRRQGLGRQGLPRRAELVSGYPLTFGREGEALGHPPRADDPLYPRRPYCVGELQAFFAQADRTAAPAPLHCTPRPALPEAEWPRGSGQQGKPSSSATSPTRKWRTCRSASTTPRRRAQGGAPQTSSRSGASSRSCAVSSRPAAQLDQAAAVPGRSLSHPSTPSSLTCRSGSGPEPS